MTPTRKKRLIFVVVLLVGIGSAATVAMISMNENMRFFISPSDVQAQVQEFSPDRQFRLGGLVVDGSVQHSEHDLTVEFSLTDGGAEVPVVFEGILPDLFREGQGIVAHGFLRNGRFEAHEVLAKHDETYMPPEVQRALDKAGHGAGPGSEATSYESDGGYGEGQG